MDRPVIVVDAASQVTEVNGQPLQHRRLSKYPNDAWALQLLVSLVG